jgi:hypothetical protein
MTKDLEAIATGIVHVPFPAFLVWLACPPHRQKRLRIGAFAAPRKAFRVLALMGLAAALAGCANADPLAVASGPVFPLNPGHWQPSRQALVAPPTIAAD